MTEEHIDILRRVNSYAEKTLNGIDPQKVPVSVQLDRLRPIMEEISSEKNMSLEDFFILYMDLQSEASCLEEQKLRDWLPDPASERKPMA